MNKSTGKLILITLICGIILPFIIVTSAVAGPANTFQDGYLQNIEDRLQKGIRVDVFRDLTNNIKDRINRRNEMESFLQKSQTMLPIGDQVMQEMNQEINTNLSNLNQEIQQRNSQRNQFASVNYIFNYVKHTDGSTVYSKNGLTARVENERIVDEFGNVELRDSCNYTYNDDRLMTSYEYDNRDIDGNVSHGEWWGATYTHDSLFYGGYDATANKNMLTYKEKVTDPQGNVRETSWNALEYNGKLATKLQMAIADDIFGNTSFTRTNITYENNEHRNITSYTEKGITSEGLEYETRRDSCTYNDKHQVTGYNEETLLFSENGIVREHTKTKAKFTYAQKDHNFGPDIEEPDPNILTRTVIDTETSYIDGGLRKETTVTDYTYNSAKNIIGAHATTEFSGDDGYGNLSKGKTETEYGLFHGKPEVTTTFTVSDYSDKDGSCRYEQSAMKYIRDWYGILRDATSTTEYFNDDGQGNTSKGESESFYKIINGKPMVIKTIDTLSSNY